VPVVFGLTVDGNEHIRLIGIWKMSFRIDTSRTRDLHNNLRKSKDKLRSSNSTLDDTDGIFI